MNHRPALMRICGHPHTPSFGKKTSHRALIETAAAFGQSLARTRPSSGTGGVPDLTAVRAYLDAALATQG